MRATARASLGLALAVALAGCGGGGGGPAAPTSGASGSTTDLAMLEGNWEGTSQQGRPMAFAVRNGRVVTLTTSWEGSGPSGGCRRASQHSMDVQIFTGGSTLGRFTHTQEDLSFFQGVFTSGSTATGAFAEVIRLPDGSSCSSGNVTWTASK